MFCLDQTSKPLLNIPFAFGILLALNQYSALRPFFLFVNRRKGIHDNFLYFRFTAKDVLEAHSRAYISADQVGNS